MAIQFDSVFQELAYHIQSGSKGNILQSIDNVNGLYAGFKDNLLETYYHAFTEHPAPDEGRWSEHHIADDTEKLREIALKFFFSQNNLQIDDQAHVDSLKQATHTFIRELFTTDREPSKEEILNNLCSLNIRYPGIKNAVLGHFYHLFPTHPAPDGGMWSEHHITDNYEHLRSAIFFAMMDFKGQLSPEDENLRRELNPLIHLDQLLQSPSGQGDQILIAIRRLDRTFPGFIGKVLGEYYHRYAKNVDTGFQSSERHITEKPEVLREIINEELAARVRGLQYPNVFYFHIYQLSQNPDKNHFPNFGQEAVSQDWMVYALAQEAYSAPIGLNNSNNNCWANSLMQILMNRPIFREHLIEKLPEHAKAIKDFARGYERDRMLHRSQASVDQNTLRHTLQMNPHRQEDAQEALSLLMMQVEDPKQSPLFTDVRTRRKVDVRNYRALEHDQSLGADGYTRWVDDPSFLHTFPLNGFRRLEEALATHLNEEGYGLHESYHAEFQEHLPTLKVERRFATLPETFAFSPKRFHRDNGHSHKICEPLYMPLTLALDGNTNVEGKRAAYQLTGFVKHNGTSVNGGHYISYLRLEDGTWVYMSDSTVHPVADHEVKEALYQSYIVFYEKSGEIDEDSFNRITQENDAEFGREQDRLNRLKPRASTTPPKPTEVPRPSLSEQAATETASRCTIQ